MRLFKIGLITLHYLSFSISGSLLLKLYNNAGHVVCAQALRSLQIGGTVHFHHHFDHCSQARKFTLINCRLHFDVRFCAPSSFTRTFCQRRLLWRSQRWTLNAANSLGNPTCTTSRSRWSCSTSGYRIRLCRILLAQRILFLFSFADKIYSLLGGHAIPDAVARTNQKFHLWIERVHLHFGESGHCHASWIQTRTLVLPVADGSTDRNYAVNSPIFNHVARSNDTWPFSWQVWLVVFTQIYGLFVWGEDGAWISSIGTEDVRGGYKDHICGTARLEGIILAWKALRWLLANLFEVFLPLLRY